MIKLVTIFLTPNVDNPTEALIAVSPDPVRLVIEVEVTDDGDQIVTDVDEVIWQYSKLPPQGSNLPPFPDAPEAIDLNVEVRLPPLNTPFNSPPANTSFSLPPSGDATASPLPAPETESYENIGINPLVPNRPREDAAPPPNEPLGFSAASDEPVEGPEQDYEYAVILTSRTSVNALDPKIIIVRRHRRRSTV